MTLGTLIGSPLGILMIGVVLLYLAFYTKFFSGLKTAGKGVGGAFGVLLVGGLIYFVATGGFSGAQVNNPSTPDNTDVIGTISLQMSAGTINGSTTGAYLNPSKDGYTFYIPNAQIADKEPINATVTIYRTNVKDAGVIRVTCQSADQTISGVTSNNLVSKTNGFIGLTLDGAGVNDGFNSVYYDVAFPVGTNSESVKISYPQDETFERGMTPYTTQSPVVCDANGKQFVMLNEAAN